MTAPLSTQHSGLRTSDGQAPIPLERVDVTAAVSDLAATVTVRQRYRNAEKTPLEVVYVFPLDEGAAVCGFEAEVDGTKYVGMVKEREEAFREYDEALEAGHGAFLLDEERADVFTASLGNLRPGGTADLTLTYVTELAAEGRGIRFTLPTTVSPRYAPAVDLQGVGRTPAEALNPPVALHVPYRFTFEMQVSAAGPIARIESPSHPITPDVQGATARVTLSQREAAMDRDLVILIEAAGMDVPHATLERGDHGSAVLVSFLPEFATSQQPAEVVFLIDRSGSMAGSSIEEVRNALELCLRSLAAGCRFNFVGFGSRFEALYTESRAYDETSLTEASAYVAGLQANLGGTEILPALDFVLDQPRVPGLPRQVVLLTDGEVTNTDEVIALARRHAGTARIFAFGIGAGASQHLVKAVARASGGAAEFIAPGERVEAKVLRQFRRVLAPALLDLRVTWPGSHLVQAPATVPPVFPGERLRLYAFGEDMPSGTIVLSGTLEGRPFRSAVPVEAASALAGNTVGRLAARARIRDLEEQPGFLEARGSRQRRPRVTQDATGEIVTLGVRYQLCSRATSFVAIEHRDEPVSQPAQLRKVPVMLTHGWGGTDRRSWLHGIGGSAGASAQMLGADAFMDAAFASTVHMGATPPTAASMRSAPDAWFRAAFSRARGAAPRSVPPARPHDAIIRLQRADGSWELTSDLIRLVGADGARVANALRGFADDRDTASTALATALAIVWLDRHAAGFRDEWEMVAEKGVAWLKDRGLGPHVDEWLDAAKEAL